MLSVLAGLALVLLLPHNLSAQCDPLHCAERITGQQINADIEWDFGTLPGSYYIYRKTSSVGTPTLMVKLPKTQKRYATTMPSGKINEFRYFYIPVEMTEAGIEKQRWNASEEILILRKTGTTRKGK